MGADFKICELIVQEELNVQLFFCIYFTKNTYGEKPLKRKIELLMVLLLLIGAIFASKRLSEHVTSEKVDKGTRTVVLDAGHGSGDPGKIGMNQVLEKDINLAIAKKVQKKLSAKGIHVVMTREDDVGFYNESESNKKIADMKKRVALINDTKPDIAVSIHQNSYPEERIKGAQVFYYTHSKEGEDAAKVMQEALRALDTSNKRLAKENSTYYMLKRTEVPTIIVECGFLSNTEEAEKLKDEDYQDQAAEAICTGIIKWLD